MRPDHDLLLGSSPSTTAMLSFSVAPPLCQRPFHPQEAGRAAKLGRQLPEETIKPLLTDRLPTAGFLRSDDPSLMTSFAPARLRASCSVKSVW